MSEYEQVRPAGAVEYVSSKPALLFGSDPRRRARAEGAIQAAGVRLVSSLGIDEGLARLEEQASLGLAWIELGEEDATPETDRLLVRLNDLAETRGTLVFASTPLPLLDMIAGRLTDRSTDLLVNPDDAQRAAVLATALSGATQETGVSDVGKDNSAQLRHLSDEIGRIAATLVRLSTGPGSPAIKPSDSPATSSPEVDAEAVRAVIRARRLRGRFFSEELFADPAWDMLLDLLQAEIAQLRVPVSSLCIAAAVPATTALRWIKTMTEQGLFVRRADPHDGRRIFVELAPAASDAMRRYFAEVGKAAVMLPWRCSGCVHGVG